jgi:hypothetical protein
MDDPRFQPGDIVMRTDDNWADTVRNGLYTVREYDLLDDVLYLEESSFRYAAYKFTLIQRGQKKEVRKTGFSKFVSRIENDRV